MSRTMRPVLSALSKPKAIPLSTFSSYPDARECKDGRHNRYSTPLQVPVPDAPFRASVSNTFNQ